MLPGGPSKVTFHFDGYFFGWAVGGRMLFRRRYDAAVE